MDKKYDNFFLYIFKTLTTQVLKYLSLKKKF